MPSLINIAEGWHNYITGNRHTKELMLKRLSTCGKCPHKQQLTEAGKIIIGLFNERGSLYKCRLCNCPLAAKTSAPGESCPDGRWDVAGT
jgi:hypothetical protein